MTGLGSYTDATGIKRAVRGVTVVDSAGAPATLPVSGTVTTSGTSTVTGNVANAAADSGNPVKIGGVFGPLPTLTSAQRGDVQLTAKGSVRANMVGTPITVADARTATSIFPTADDNISSSSPLQTWNMVYNGATLDRQRGDTNGLVVQPALSATYWAYAAAASGIVSSTAGVTIKAAAGAGVRNYLKSLSLDHDTLSAATEFVVRDGASGTILWRGKLQTTAEQGRRIAFDPPLRGTANTLMEIAALSSVTGGIYVNAQGYTGA